MPFAFQKNYLELVLVFIIIIIFFFLFKNSIFWYAQGFDMHFPFLT